MKISELETKLYEKEKMRVKEPLLSSQQGLFISSGQRDSIFRPALQINTVSFFKIFFYLLLNFVYVEPKPHSLSLHYLHVLFFVFCDPPETSS